MNTVVVAGATGVVGRAAAERFAASGWRVIALSRRPIPQGPNLTPLAVDLTDREGTAAALASLSGVTHAVYAALYELPGLVAGWTDPGQMETNRAMFANFLDPLAARSGLRHVSVLQGAKAYGGHLHRISVPAKERAPRDDHPNFYWLQEDHLRAAAEGAAWDWTILRPQVVFGGATGSAMNIAPVLGVFAALCAETGRPFAYPGGPAYLWEAADARLGAKALEGAAEAPAAARETFNIANGDVADWTRLWPAIAEALGAAPAEPASLSLAGWLPGQAAAWAGIAARHGLAVPDLARLLGESHHYADRILAHAGTRARDPQILSTIKLRQAGFHACQDTEDMFRETFDDLRARRILPPL
ncbi:MAG: NAD-dependent epimerase/dehydratase family protein [Pseudomonadota bacterium]|nr:NAD-dependent epimerase/dehydratase family protein [Pseudomonadota bacterium]